MREKTCLALLSSGCLWDMMLSVTLVVTRIHSTFAELPVFTIFVFTFVKTSLGVRK